MSTSGKLQGNNTVAQNTYEDRLNSVKELIGFINEDFLHQSLKETESALHSLWEKCFEAAIIIPADDPVQDTLVQDIIQRLGTSGSLRPKNTPKYSALRYPYPLLAEHLSNAWLDGWKWFKKEDTLNLAAFTARLVEASEQRIKLCFCAVLVLRETLEVRRRLNVKENGTDTAVADLLPAAVAWLEFAGHKLAGYCSDTYKPSAEGGEGEASLAAVGHLALNAGVSTPGFNPKRWHFWEERLEMLSSVDDEEIKKQALKGRQLMDDAWEDRWDAPI